jgi:organic radical activating enzyme
MNKYIRTFCRKFFTVTGTWKLASAIRRSGIANAVRNVFHKRNIFINSEGKIVFPHLDIYITKSCNLKCEHCASYNPFRSGIIPKNEAIKTIKQWSERIAPKTISLLGGEPLLHPDYQEITIAARNAWKQSALTIITNGLLLPKVPENFLKQMANEDIGFVISRHINTENYNRHLNEDILRLEKLGVKYEIIESHKSWVTCHSLDSDGVPISPNSNPLKSWTHCLAKRCTTISGNQLCYCSIIINILQAVTEGSLPLAEFNDITKHKLVTLDDSNETILRYLNSRVLKECRFCPENFENIEARQIPTEKLIHIKKIITKMNSEFNNSQSNQITIESTSNLDNNNNQINKITAKNAG